MTMRSFGALVIGIGLSCGFSATVAQAADIVGNFEIKPIGTPLGSTTPPNKPYMLKVTLVVNGKPVTKDVAVSTIKAFEMPKQNANEPIRDYATRVLEAQGEASHAKAVEIADAINKEFNLQKPEEKAGAQFVTVKRTVRVNNTNVPGVEAPFGSLVLQGVLEKQGNPVKIVEPGLAGENRNGGNWVPRPGQQPSGAKVGMALPFGPSSATGFDPVGEPSLIEFGIEDLYVAEFNPAPDMSDLEVFDTLEEMLDTHGLPATFDSSLMELFLDDPLPDGRTLIFGNSDVGLDFSVSFDHLDPIPEPTSTALMATGFIGLLAATRRRRYPVNCRA